jgi:hypothetical protein
MRKYSFVIAAALQPAGTLNQSEFTHTKARGASIKDAILNRSWLG